MLKMGQDQQRTLLPGFLTAYIFFHAKKLAWILVSPTLGVCISLNRRDREPACRSGAYGLSKTRRHRNH